MFLKYISFHSIVSTGILIWVIIICLIICIMITNQELIGKDIYRFGPNKDLYILGFCIDTKEKYTCIVIFCFINSMIRTLNNEIIKPWITNQIQDISKPIKVSTFDAYEISCVYSIYIWFDFFMYMNILLTQVDMIFIEINADLFMTVILTRYYLKREHKELKKELNDKLLNDEMLNTELLNDKLLNDELLNDELLNDEKSNDEKNN